MSRTRRLPLWAVLGSAAIIFSACAGTTPSASSSAAAPSTAASAPAATSAASESAYAGKSYPDKAVDCANPPKYTSGANSATYSGIFSQIKAVDRLTVEMDLCAADVAFLSKIAFDSNNIQDSDWLNAHAADKSITHNAINGTGPYMVKEWVPGDHVTLAANPNYWGTPPLSPTVVVKWSKEATQRLQELPGGHGRWHRQRRHQTTLRPSRRTATSS